LLFVFLLSAGASAQVDHFGQIDTVYTELSKISDGLWSITVNVTNDENVRGLAVPLKLSAGTDRLIADSVVYKGGRVEHFDYAKFRYDTSLQCVTLGMVADLTGSDKMLKPGEGRVATIFVSAVEDQPIEELVVDTTTTHPSNTLMLVADSKEIERVLGEEMPTQADKRVEITPAFVVRMSK
jgi:hypothetical protein